MGLADLGDRWVQAHQEILKVLAYLAHRWVQEHQVTQGLQVDQKVQQVRCYQEIPWVRWVQCYQGLLVHQDRLGHQLHPAFLEILEVQASQWLLLFLAHRYFPGLLEVQEIL